MKKTNMKNFLTLLIAMLSLLPTAMHGADKKVVTSIDITIPLPQDGMYIAVSYTHMTLPTIS